MRRFLANNLLVTAATAACLVATASAIETTGEVGELRVGAAAVAVAAEDGMIIGGGILPKTFRGQEGELRATAVVLALANRPKVAIVACDALMLSRDLLDPVTREIESKLGIPARNVLINCTHTHHAPSTVTVHGYQRDEEFCRRFQQAIVEAVSRADADLRGPATFEFRLGEESSVGQNSRYVMADGVASWGREWERGLRPTGPFDPELPVLAFRLRDGELAAMIFNHSTHTIGAVRGNVRSPAFYGLAAQDLEKRLGGEVLFLEGASGSTHNLTLEPAEAMLRVEEAVLDALSQARPRPVDRLVSIKRPFSFHVRNFDETKEEAAVAAYCQTYRPEFAESTREVFRQQRRVLWPDRGQERITWLQAMLIGDVAIVGVPAEFFTKLGQDIKRRSPFRHTYVAELANDWIGYLPDRKAFEFGGYQTWTGLHSYAEVGTGESMVDEVVAMLDELADD